MNPYIGFCTLLLILHNVDVTPTMRHMFSWFCECRAKQDYNLA